MTAELIALGLTASNAGTFAWTFTELDIEGEGRLVELSEPPILIIYPKSNIFTFTTSERTTLGEVFKERLRPEFPDGLGSFAVVSWAALLRRVKDRLAERKA